MEDFTIDIMIDKGPSARSVQLNIDPFTLVGQQRLGNLTSPLRDRFGVVLRVEYYQTEELFHIINRSSEILELKLTAKELWNWPVAVEEPQNCQPHRGVPEIMQSKAKGKINLNVAASLKKLGIDEIGLDEMDRKILG